MRASRTTVLLFLCSLIPASLAAQQSNSTATPQTAQRDPQAVAVLTQALNVAGGVSVLSAIQDYTASGTANYYWGDGEQATVVVKGRGTSQFRVDATLPEGLRSWAVSDGMGFVKEANGTTDTIFTQNAVNRGNLTFPLAHIAASLQDLSMSLTYVGLEAKDGIQVHHIRIQKLYPQGSDPTGILGKLSKREFFVDSSTFYVVSSEDMTHPRDRANVDYLHEVRFSDYRQVNGVLVPFSIAETVEGHPITTIQLIQITFNTGLQDSDFAQ